PTWATSASTVSCSGCPAGTTTSCTCSIRRREPSGKSVSARNRMALRCGPSPDATRWATPGTCVKEEAEHDLRHQTVELRPEEAEGLVREADRQPLGEQLQRCREAPQRHRDADRRAR